MPDRLGRRPASLGHRCADRPVRHVGRLVHRHLGGLAAEPAGRRQHPGVPPLGVGGLPGAGCHPRGARRPAGGRPPPRLVGQHGARPRARAVVAVGLRVPGGQRRDVLVAGHRVGCRRRLDGLRGGAVRRGAPGGPRRSRPAGGRDATPDPARHRAHPAPVLPRDRRPEPWQRDQPAAPLRGHRRPRAPRVPPHDPPRPPCRTGHAARGRTGAPLPGPRGQLGRRRRGRRPPGDGHVELGQPRGPGGSAGGRRRGRRRPPGAATAQRCGRGGDVPRRHGHPRRGLHDGAPGPPRRRGPPVAVRSRGEPAGGSGRAGRGRQPPRHHGPEAGGGRARAPGLPRFADRAGQPGAVRRSGGAGAAAGRPHRRGPRRAVPRPRRVQEDQRQPRSPRRRRRPQRDRGPAGRIGPRRRHRRAARRRRVRHPHRGSGHDERDRPRHRGPDPRLDAPPGGGRRAPGAPVGERRHLCRRRRHVGDRPAPQRRPRDVPRQGAGQGPVDPLRARDERRRAQAAPARSGSHPCGRARRAHARLPAGGRPGGRDRGRLRGAHPLAPPDLGADLTGSVHPRRRGQRDDPPHRAVGDRDGLPRPPPAGCGRRNRGCTSR